MSGMNAKIRFMSKEQEQFYKKMMKKSRVDDSYHRSFFYCMGLSEVTRANIRKLYNFERGYAEPDGLHTWIWGLCLLDAKSLGKMQSVIFYCPRIIRCDILINWTSKSNVR